MFTVLIYSTHTIAARTRAWHVYVCVNVSIRVPPKNSNENKNKNINHWSTVAAVVAAAVARLHNRRRTHSPKMLIEAIICMRRNVQQASSFCTAVKLQVWHFRKTLM